MYSFTVYIVCSRSVSTMSHKTGLNVTKVKGHLLLNGDCCTVTLDVSLAVDMYKEAIMILAFYKLFDRSIYSCCHILFHPSIYGCFVPECLNDRREGILLESLCIKLPIEHSTTCDSRTNLNYVKRGKIKIVRGKR